MCVIPPSCSTRRRGARDRGRGAFAGPSSVSGVLGVSASVDEALEPRNATEDAILVAARQALVEEPYDRLTMDGIARRAHVSRTAVYFYFPNKRAVIDRLIQQAFSDMYEASSPYLDGDGEPRLQLRLGLARMVSCVNSHGPVLLLDAHLSGREDRLPTEW